MNYIKLILSVEYLRVAVFASQIEVNVLKQIFDLFLRHNIGLNILPTCL
jgi:hypothetical protein